MVSAVLVTTIRLRMSGFSIIFHFHNSATIVTISFILDILDSTIRESNLIFSINVSSFISRSVFTEVCVIVIIMNTIFKLEWIWLLIFIISITSTAMTNIMTYMFNREITAADGFNWAMAGNAANRTMTNGGSN